MVLVPIEGAYVTFY